MSFSNVCFTMAFADWIVQLGPQTFMGDAACAPCYEYAIVSFV